MNSEYKSTKVTTINTPVTDKQILECPMIQDILTVDLATMQGSCRLHSSMLGITLDYEGKTVEEMVVLMTKAVIKYSEDHTISED